MSKITERYEKLKGQNMDSIIAKINNGEIECGSKVNIVKMNKNDKFRGKVIFAKDDEYTTEQR